MYHQPAGVTMYGSLAKLDLWYKSAAILIKIPKWSEFCHAVSTGESCNEIGIEDRMSKDFKDIIEEDVIQEEIEKFRDNQQIKAVERLVNALKKTQIDLKSYLSTLAEFI